MTKPWIDFKELRGQLDFKRVLDHYKVETGRAKGAQLSCFCPLPEHDGQRRSPSFSAELQKGIFQCFGCGEKGNMLEFAVLMEGGDPDDGKALRATALKLAKAFGISTERQASGKTGQRKNTSVQSEDPKPSEQEPEPDGDEENLPVKINVPLTFELKSLDQAHGYFESAGIALPTVQHFGLGYSEKGLMKGRIAIPIHNAGGDLIAYAGRLVDGEEPSGETPPKYFFPPPREADGFRFEFHKSELLYNRNHLRDPLEELIVVEGFRDVWHLWQNGHENVCALMGTSCSQCQAEMILSLTGNGRVRLMFDADPAGRRCTQETFMLIGQHRRTEWVELPEGKDPAEIDPGELPVLLE